MSLILEALRKLDREKRVPERGFLVMAPAAWPSHDGARRPWAWVALALAALAIGALALRGRPQREPVAQAPQAVHASAPLLAPATAAPAPLPTPAAAPAAATLPPSAPLAAPPTGPAAPTPATPASLGPSTTASATPTLVLQAISERDGLPIALINDRMLREGDEIDGARIVKIGETFVEIDYQGQRTALRF